MPAWTTSSTTCVRPSTVRNDEEMPSKVLIATDGSDFAIDAAKRAAALVDQAAQITVITVVPLPVIPATAPVTGLDAGPIVTPEATEELDQALHTEAQASLTRTVGSLGRPAEHMLVVG